MYKDPTDAFMMALVAMVFVFTVLVVISLVYDHYDSSTGTVVMGVGIVIDKEQEIHKSDGSETGRYYYFVVKNGEQEKRVATDETIYWATVIGSQVVRYPMPEGRSLSLAPLFQCEALE